jgi:hypothetical protein
MLIQLVREVPAVEQLLYADTVNSRFHKSQSHYVGLAERFRSSVSENEHWKISTLDDSIENFRIKNSHIKRWEDIQLCSAESTTLDLIDIDITLQRLYDFIHGCNILSDFKQIFVMPICVYREPLRPGRFVCWDGQHTAIALWVIASKILGLDISKCRIPIVVYRSELKSEMRECFISLNGDAKQPLDHIDLVHQKVFGVRTDNSPNLEWRTVEKKYQALENCKIFLTHKKFNDTDMPGAYSRLDEFIDPAYEPVITEYFAKYFFKMCNSSRPVRPKESWIFYDFFKLCTKAKIDVDNQYIREIVRSLKTAMGGDFDSEEFYNKAKRSYQEWWRANKPYPDGTLWGISYNEQRIALTFLLAQIRKNTDVPLPNCTPLWKVPQGDLF